MDPLIHAEMAMLIQQEKKLQEEIAALREELPVWQKRIRLAEERGMAELADQARDRLRQIKDRAVEIQYELDTIDLDKSRLRKENRRPTGQEVRRAEALLDSFRQMGIDPDRAMLERELEKLGRNTSDVDKLGDDE